jgi:hypothetical protein
MTPEQLKNLIKDLRLNHEFCPKEIILQAADELEKQRTWVGLMRGVRVEGDTVVITVKGGNDAARQLCGDLIKEMNK